VIQSDVDRASQQHRQKVLASRVHTNGTARAAKGSLSRRPDKSRDNARWVTLNTFVDAELAGLKATEVRVWLVLYRDVKPGGLARTGMTDIARRAGVSRRAVVKAINGLKKRGLIEVVTRGSINGTPNVYRLLNTGA
jgi:CRP-like cAMP-binding protein